jgi:hypothetical protein
MSHAGTQFGEKRPSATARPAIRKPNQGKDVVISGESLGTQVNLRTKKSENLEACACEKYGAGASTEDTRWNRLWRRGLDGLTSAHQIERSTAEENEVSEQKSSSAGPNTTSRRPS